MTPLRRRYRRIDEVLFRWYGTDEPELRIVLGDVLNGVTCLRMDSEPWWSRRYVGIVPATRQRPSKVIRRYTRAGLGRAIQIARLRRGLPRVES